MPDVEVTGEINQVNNTIISAFEEQTTTANKPAKVSTEQRRHSPCFHNAPNIESVNKPNSQTEQGVIGVHTTSQELARLTSMLEKRGAACTIN